MSLEGKTDANKVTFRSNKLIRVQVAYTLQRYSREHVIIMKTGQLPRGAYPGNLISVN